MARGKANFSGDHSAAINYDEAAVRAAIVKAIPALGGADYLGLVEEIETAAWEAAWILADSAMESHRRDQHAELEKLRLLVGKQAGDKLASVLRRLSPDVWRAFQVNGFDLSTAIDHPMEFCEAIERVLTADLPAKRRDGKVQGDASLALAKRVHAALAPHAPVLGITLSGHGRDYIHCSPLVTLLGRLGDCIGLEFEATAWRDQLVKVRKNGEDTPIRG